jgi:hypothetical protein
MRSFVLPLLVLSAATTLAACATQTGFEWGSYDAALYAYSKNPEQLPRYEQALEAAIAKGRAEGRIAPGLQAELGYCYLSEGKKDAALRLFNSEVADFPEARPFLAKIIERTAG